MRVARLAYVVAPLTAVALLVLYGKSQVRGGDDLHHITDGARHLRELDARLDRAVLEADNGLSLDYDSLTATVREMHATQAEIERFAAPYPELAVATEKIAGRIREKSSLVEQFESGNSVLKNSLVYIPLAALRASSALGGDETADQARTEITALVSDVLRCKTDCSPEVVDAMRHDATALAATRELVAGPAKDNIAVLLRHAQLLISAQPRLDGSIRKLLDAEGRPYDDLFEAAHRKCEQAIESANTYRAWLVALSVALLVAIALMVLRLRMNAAALKKALVGLATEKGIVEEKQRELRSLNQSLESRVDERTRELSRSREQYRTLVESTQAVPWEMAPGTLDFVYAGPQATQLVGHAPTAWVEEGFLSRTVHSESVAEVVRWFEALSGDGQVGELELELVNAEGRSVWVRAFVTANTDAGGRVVRRGLFLDVTSRRVLEAELRSAQKLESVGRLASGVAHEINTPIQFVSDSVHFVTDAFSSLGPLVTKLRELLAAEETELPRLLQEAQTVDAAGDTDFLLENIPDALASSVEGLNRIAAIVKALKAFSHPDRPTKSFTDLNRSLESTLAIATNEYKLVADVVTELGELPPVMCHGGEINQVLLNLIVNAAHAIGDVVKGTTNRGTIHIKTWCEGENAFVSIRDTGGGIPQNIRHKIFEPFFTTKDVGRGTGQGLAISRTIVVEKHGGELTFDTELGRGTTFTLRLPIEDGSARIPAVAEAA